MAPLAGRKGLAAARTIDAGTILLWVIGTRRAAQEPGGVSAAVVEVFASGIRGALDGRQEDEGAVVSCVPGAQW